MPVVLVALAVHVGMGALWALTTLAVAIRGRVGAAWSLGLLGAAGLNMLAGIYLWHALHAGPWGRAEHLLAIGTFCAFLALGIQMPIVLTAPYDGLLDRPALIAVRLTLVIILAAATAMIASRF